MITVTSPTAKLPKEAGWNTKTELSFTTKPYISEDGAGCVMDIISAPTAQEPMEALPKYVEVFRDDGFYACIYDGATNDKCISSSHESLCEALAALWLEINKK